MSEYKIRNTGDCFEVVQLRPTVIGRFDEEQYAKMFLAGLNPAGEPKALPKPLAPTTSKTDAPAPMRPIKAAKPKSSPSKEGDETPWTDEELEDAFYRLLNGEKLQDIASEHGKSWTALRSKWAANKRELTQETSTHIESGASCQNCGRSFKPTPESLDLCARCRHD